MKIILNIILFISLTAFIAFAQEGRTGKDIIEISVNKLQQKVLLSDKQAAEITTLMNRNIDGFLEPSTKDKTIDEVKIKIEQMLDDRQKSKYEIIKNDWWNNLSSDISRAAKQ